MKDPLGVSPSTGNQRNTFFDLDGNRTYDLWIRSTVTLPTELRGRTEKEQIKSDRERIDKVGQGKSGTTS